jgi:transcriptional regulator with XRE-family HTH domain
MAQLERSRAELAIAHLIFDYERRMAELGINFAEVARRLGVSRARVSGLMNGRQNPTIGTLMRIAEVMDCYLRIELAPLELPVRESSFAERRQAAGVQMPGQQRKSPVLRVSARSKKKHRARHFRITD